MEHHKHLGEDGIDTDLPSRLELVCLNNVLGETFFMLVYHVPLSLLHIDPEKLSQDIPDSFLCHTSGIRAHPNAHNMAPHQYRRRTHFQCAHRENIRHQLTNISHHEQLLRREFTSLCGTFYCGTLFVGWVGTGDTVITGRLMCWPTMYVLFVYLF